MGLQGSSIPESPPSPPAPPVTDVDVARKAAMEAAEKLAVLEAKAKVQAQFAGQAQLAGTPVAVMAPASTKGPNGGELVNVKLPVDGGKPFEWEVGKVKQLLNAPPGKNMGDMHQFEVFMSNTKSVTIQLPVQGGERFEHVVDRVPLTFTAPKGAKRGQLHEFTYPWPLDLPTANGAAPPLGCPGGGRWVYNAKFAGTQTNLACCLLCVLGGAAVCCGLPIYACPIDQRDEYHVLSPADNEHMLMFDRNGDCLGAKGLNQDQVHHRRASMAQRMARV